MRLRRRGRMLRAKLYQECATALLTEVFDGVLNRLEQAGEPELTEPEAAWLHEMISRIADRFVLRGQTYTAGL